MSQTALAVVRDDATVQTRDEIGATTAEYATVTGCGVGFAAVLFKFLTSDVGPVTSASRPMALLIRLRGRTRSNSAATREAVVIDTRDATERRRTRQTDSVYGQIWSAHSNP